MEKEGEKRKGDKCVRGRMKESREEKKWREEEERQRGRREKETENSDRCIGACTVEEESTTGKQQWQKVHVHMYSISNCGLALTHTVPRPPNQCGEDGSGSILSRHAGLET